jgi:UDP-3-O-[3-hydroxymyristoyl] glucosamine N-acyltransferase
MEQRNNLILIYSQNEILKTHSLKEIATIDCQYIGDDFPVEGMNEIHVVTSVILLFVDHPNITTKSVTPAATIVLINKEVDCPKVKHY